MFHVHHCFLQSKLSNQRGAPVLTAHLQINANISDALREEKAEGKLEWKNEGDAR